MAVVFKNNANTVLTADISSSATSISVQAGNVFPSLSAGEYFLCTIDDDTNNEIVKVTAISGNTLTVVRAQEGTTARAFSTSNTIEARLTAGIMNVFPQLDGGTLTADTDTITEGSTNLYYTDARAQAVSINNVVEDTSPQLGGTLDTNDQLIQFGDSSGETVNRLQFGASQDLQIYHNGSHSNIRDVGSGNLYIDGSASINFRSGDAGETYAIFNDDGAVSLYYNNAVKLATSNTGVTVTGEVAATSLDISGDVDVDGTLETDALTINGTTSVAFESADHSKLDGIEASADVTDAANVGAALTAFSTTTDAASADLVAFYDVSASAWEKSTVANLVYRDLQVLQAPAGAKGTEGRSR